jgi:hypothetical protein
MRFRTRRIELEAVRFDGNSVAPFARQHTLPTSEPNTVLIDTHEGERICKIGDYFVLTDAGQLLVRNGGVFEAVFEPVMVSEK